MLTYPKLRETLNVWGGKLVERLKKELKNSSGAPISKFYASGETDNSIKYAVRKTKGKDDIGIRIYAQRAGKKKYTVVDVINRGQKKSFSPLPPRKIGAWLQAKNIQLRSVTKSGRLKARERTPQNLKRAAIAIAKSIRQKGSIKRFGYSGSNIYRTAFQPYSARMKFDISKAYSQDVNAHIKREIRKQKNAKINGN